MVIPTNEENLAYASVAEAWNNTYSGKKVYFLEPERSDIDIVDIAVGLARMPRYSGQIKPFYSVAQHSVLVSQHVSQVGYLPMAGLLHDASEAFMGDICSPLKSVLPDYREIEKRLMSVILTEFGMHYPLPDEVKRIDAQMLATEVRDLAMHRHKDWVISTPPIPNLRLDADKCWDPDTAIDQFLLRWHQLEEI